MFLFLLRILHCWQAEEELAAEIAERSLDDDGMANADWLLIHGKIDDNDDDPEQDSDNDNDDIIVLN